MVQRYALMSKLAAKWDQERGPVDVESLFPTRRPIRTLMTVAGCTSVVTATAIATIARVTKIAPDPVRSVCPTITHIRGFVGKRATITGRMDLDPFPTGDTRFRTPCDPAVPTWQSPFTSATLYSWWATMRCQLAMAIVGNATRICQKNGPAFAITWILGVPQGSTT